MHFCCFLKKPGNYYKRRKAEQPTTCAKKYAGRELPGEQWFINKASELSESCEHDRSFIAKAGFTTRSTTKRLQWKLEENSGACWNQWKDLGAVSSNCSSLKNGSTLQSLYHVKLLLHFLLFQRLLATNLSIFAVTIMGLSSAMSLPYLTGTGIVNDCDYTALREVQYQ